MNFKKSSWVVIVILFFVVIFVFSFLKKNNSQTFNIQYVKIAGQSIKVDLALTAPQQEQGLSGRAGLKEDEGMLFVFEKPDRYFFWMKDMNFPIDMVWLAPSEAGIGEDLKVIYIKKDARPESYPATFGPDKNAKYVLEVVSGFADKNNLKEGDTVELTN
jgi:uncharacterized membrane protein (UPF0127 family)